MSWRGDVGAVLIAEGIATSAELLALRDLGVPLGQGYHLAHPASDPPQTPCLRALADT